MNEIMQGLTSVDLRAAYANAIIAHPAGILGGVDFLNTGRVERVDTKSLHLFLNEGIIPVIPPIGYDGEGRTFRVNSDGIALEVAEAMQAMKILYLSASEGVIVDGEVIGQLSIAEAEELVKKKRGCRRPRLALEARARRARLPAGRGRACICSMACATKRCSARSSATRASARWSTRTSTSRSAASSKRTCAR